MKRYFTWPLAIFVTAMAFAIAPTSRPRTAVAASAVTQPRTTCDPPSVLVYFDKDLPTQYCECVNIGAGNTHGPGVKCPAD